MKGIKKALLALAVIAITAGYAWQANRVITPAPATWDDVLDQASAGGYRIISTEELAGRHGEDPSGLLLVDTRQPWEYRSGYIKGALNFPMEPTWWARWRKAGDLEGFLGPDKDRTLVFY